MIWPISLLCAERINFSAASSGVGERSAHVLSARGRHELHARVLNHWFTREASRPFIVQMLATCPHNLSKDAIATSARELYQSVEDGYPLTHTASRSIFYFYKTQNNLCQSVNQSAPDPGPERSWRLCVAAPRAKDDAPKSLLG